MTFPTLHIGDDVEVIGPSITGNNIHLGETFKIKCMYVNPSQHIQFEPYDGTYYPASSLRLVEPELKIGDWVRGIYNGHIFQIDYIKPRMESKTLDYSGKDEPMYLASSLRKLTPDEIKQHTNPGKQYPITPAKDFDELTLRDVARMAGICKNEYGVWISTLLKRAHETEDRLSAIEKRLDFIEKFQREQAEATQYRRNMLWMAGP